MGELDLERVWGHQITLKKPSQVRNHCAPMRSRKDPCRYNRGMHHQEVLSRVVHIIVRQVYHDGAP